MARRNHKKAAREAYKYIKKGGWAAVVALILVVVILLSLYFYFFVYKGYTFDELFGGTGTGGGGNPPREPVHAVEMDGTVQTEEMSIHFLELGNKYSGDCTLVKVGNTEVLIDAGSRKGSAEVLVPKIQQ